jgi:hypothetical protein
VVGEDEEAGQWGSGGPAARPARDRRRLRRAVEKLDRLRPWFYDSVYANEACDLQIDTVRHDPEEVCDLIEQRLTAGPGTSFEILRRRTVSS